MRLLLVAFLALLAFSLGAQTGSKQFGDYWYAGTAEISSYELLQSRYGEMRRGYAVNIFVTEPFSKRKQVKLDRSMGSADEVTVMKLNQIKKFPTGIYDYAMMMSSFVPVSFDQYPDAIKVTATSQEWCGQTFTQLNLAGDEYHFSEFSYFESEGDRNVDIPNEWLEDELWQRIRLNPEELPTGSIRILPGTLHGRLAHSSGMLKTAEAMKGEANGSIVGAEGMVATYELKYSDRSLVIYYQNRFPYVILGWTETYKGRKTTAKRMVTIQSPYWQKNSVVNESLRSELGIDKY